MFEMQWFIIEIYIGGVAEDDAPQAMDKFQLALDEHELLQNGMVSWQRGEVVARVARDGLNRSHAADSAAGEVREIISRLLPELQPVISVLVIGEREG